LEQSGSIARFASVAWCKLANYKKPEDLIGENGLLKQLTKLLVERALDAELTEHLGHESMRPVANPAGNTRNGKSKKTLKGEFGELPIEVPRDRHGSFEPQLIPKHQTRWAGFDDKIISLYARGMTVREIQATWKRCTAPRSRPA
jgi:putative transposase